MGTGARARVSDGTRRCAVMAMTQPPDTRRLARKLAARLKLEENLFGAKSFRIGGATDYRAVYGPEAAERIIKQRGRWWSDIHALYQRALAAEHLQGSAAIADARGAELEALCKGWVQPTTFR